MNGPTSVLPTADREAERDDPSSEQDDLLLVEEISIDGMCGVY